MAPSNILLGSHVLIWLINNEKGIGQQARELIDQAAVVYVSAASIGELNIKKALGQIELPHTFEADVLEPVL